MQHVTRISSILFAPLVCRWDRGAKRSWENHVKNGQTDYEWGFNGKVMEVNG